MVQNARGTRDFLPERQILRQSIITSLREVFERHGFSPLDTPAIERFDVLSAKYAGGEEILKETFKFSDQGERDLGLRYDLTVPLARVMAQNPELKMPFRRYQIDKVWRDGPVSTGRYREFIQCDVDCVGAPEGWQDAELLRMIDEGFTALGLKVSIHVNHIKVLTGILAAAGIAQEKRPGAMLTIDKLRKVGPSEVSKELEAKGISAEHVAKLFELMAGEGRAALADLSKHVPGEEEKAGIAAMETILARCNGFANTIHFEPSLARGLSYYTGMIVEVFLDDSQITSAVCAGGRYDGLIGAMADAGREFPAVGVSFGIDRIFDALASKKARKTVTQSLIIPLKTQEESDAIARELREAGINTEVAYDKGLTKALDYANAMGIPWVLIVGQRELNEKKVKLKNMEAGDEALVTVEAAIKKIIH